jgi:wyosine [tRNA(Phe)-imidazoG37] synthetase (radical SAM superfamily)
MGVENFKHIYGPVPSWRLGRSLGIDPVSTGSKICNFDCVYCQVGKTAVRTGERKLYISCADILEELKSLPPMPLDYITFSGAGEPTLAENLGEMIRAVKKARPERIAVITNSSLLHRKEVREDLLAADFIIAKLDAPSQEIFSAVNGPLEFIQIEQIISGLKLLRESYQGKLALQMMFVKQNKLSAKELSRIAREIGSDEVQVNTPLRPCRSQPLSQSELERIEARFCDLHTVSVYRAEIKKIKPISDADTLRIRGKV